MQEGLRGAEDKEDLQPPRTLSATVLVLDLKRSMQLGCDLTYRIYYHRSKHRCSNFGAVRGIISAAHHAVVAVREHAADCAEDYDGEDGDDDANMTSVSSPIGMNVLVCYHDQALNAFK